MTTLITENDLFESVKEWSMVRTQICSKPNSNRLLNLMKSWIEFNGGVFLDLETAEISEIPPKAVGFYSDCDGYEYLYFKDNVMAFNFMLIFVDDKPKVIQN